MKLLILTLALCIVSVSYAEEVNTDCQSMSESREKIVKTAKPKNVRGSQVVGK